MSGEPCSNTYDLYCSQSTEDSEPVYDQLHMDRCQSDSEPERTSSASPPICDTSPYSNVADDVYSEIAPRDTDQLIKPSHVKTRRIMYAGEYIFHFVTVLLKNMLNSIMIGSSSFDISSSKTTVECSHCAGCVTRICFASH